MLGKIYLTSVSASLAPKPFFKLEISRVRHWSGPIRLCWAVHFRVQPRTGDLRQAIHSATNKSERFNEFVQCISFGGDSVIAARKRGA